MSDIYNAYPQFEKRKIEFLHRADVLRSRRSPFASLLDFSALHQTIDRVIAIARGEPDPFAEVVDEVEQQDAEIADDQKWLTDVSELPTGDQTALAYGGYDLTVEQRDFIDWERETKQTRESDRPL